MEKELIIEIIEFYNEYKNNYKIKIMFNFNSIDFLKKLRKENVNYQDLLILFYQHILNDSYSSAIIQKYISTSHFKDLLNKKLSKTNIKIYLEKEKAGQGQGDSESAKTLDEEIKTRVKSILESKEGFIELIINSIENYKKLK